MKILSIRPRKKKGMYQVCLDVDAFDLHETILARYLLRENMELDEAFIKEIKGENEKYLLKEQAIRYLARRNHASGELVDKLKRKGYGEQAIRKLVAELTEKQILNDEVFAEQYIRDKIQIGKKGPRAIRFELNKKGVENSLIDSLIERLYPEEIQMEIALSLGEKKLKSSRKKSSREQKTEIYQYLAGRGFGINIIQTILNEIFS